MKRVENYRTGDRAEKLGLFLLQAFCAVAEVPRQEDFGLMDAVATLLRRNGRCVYAEDSCLVQVKSRTVRTISYLGTAFENLLCQDLSLLVALVDLRQSSIELHTLGIAMSHPNINDAEGLVAHLHAHKSRTFELVDGVLHVPLRKPILRWTTGDTENRTFVDQAYSVLKTWLEIERWNRRYRRAGLFRKVTWETNAVPSEGGEIYTSNQAQDATALGEIAPVVRLLASYAVNYTELRAPVRAVLHWLRGRGVEADPSGIHGLMLLIRDSNDRLRKALEGNPEAIVAVTFHVAEVRPDFLAFWVFVRDQVGRSNGKHYAGSLQALREHGFEAKVDIVEESNAVVTVGLSDEWLRQHNLADSPLMDTVEQMSSEQGSTQVFLLRKPDLQCPQEPGEDISTLCRKASAALRARRLPHSSTAPIA